jgi:hypothetical protein
MEKSAIKVDCGLANKMNLKKKKLVPQKIVFSLIAEIIKSKFNV